MQLVELHETDFELAWEILEESFPPEERRTKAGQKALLKEEPYHLYGYWENDELQAILAAWDFEQFVFGEHFAVRKTVRGKGLGEHILQAFLSTCKKTVLLEVELPVGEIEKRRIAFYERNGFYLNEYDYIQPPLQQGCEAIPLYIMTLPEALPEEKLNYMRDELYRVVYHV